MNREVRIGLPTQELQKSDEWGPPATMRYNLSSKLCLRRMTDEHPARLRFDSFELDLRTRELSKEGRPVRLQDQPARLLALLASRPGELVTRAEIEKSLWGDAEFVEFEHSINTAMRKIREALGDNLERPRFIETLPRKGYRFIAAVESAHSSQPMPQPAIQTEEPSARNFREKIPLRGQVKENHPAPEPAVLQPTEPNALAQAPSAALAEFALPGQLARPLFLVIQFGYLAIYATALYRAESLDEALVRLLPASASFLAPGIVISAMCGIAVRLYLLTSVGFQHPAAGTKFQRLFVLLFVLDTFWAASPLLLVQTMGYGLALASVAALAYLPFTQRTLIQSLYRQPFRKL